MTISSLFPWTRRDGESIAAGERGSTDTATADLPRFPRGGDPASLITAGRYTTLLTGEYGNAPDALTLIRAWEALEEHMALVPAGEVTPHNPGNPDEPETFVPANYIDRCTVTNEQFAEFVADGGYDMSELWPEDAWPYVAQLTDKTGYPGPKYWQRGEPSASRLKHPVVGVCWYEANAYAVWSGKRLPSAAEWERAGTWPTNLENNKVSVKYPWGNSFDPSRANLWSSGAGTTLPVDSCPSGCTPNGVYQLIGNVWEWTADPYYGPAVREGLTVQLDNKMIEIRGGAFDTYFETQATCRFRTGKSVLFRGANVGFRCVATAEDLRRPADSGPMT